MMIIVIILIIVMSIVGITSVKVSADDVDVEFLCKWPEDPVVFKFKSPKGIAIYKSEYIYVVDTRNHRIQRFYLNGRFSAVWGKYGSGPEDFSFPHGIAVDAEGNIYVADTGNHRIKKLKGNGEPTEVWYGFNQMSFRFPKGIAVDRYGSIYVADTGNHRIQKLSSGTSLLWGGWGTTAGKFISPQDVAVDKDGYVYVADTGNNRIQKFDSQGNFIEAWENVAGEPIRFDKPTGIAVDSMKQVYVINSGNSSVHILDSGGITIRIWGNEDQLIDPQAVDVDFFGNVYIADAGGDSIQIFTCEGTLIDVWSKYGVEDGMFYTPMGIDFDSQGYIYIADTDNHRVQKFDSNGRFITKWGRRGQVEDGEFLRPCGIAVDRNDGDKVYVADTENCRIQVFENNGEFIGKFGTYGEGKKQFRFPRDIEIDNDGYIYILNQSSTTGKGGWVEILKRTGKGYYDEDYTWIGTWSTIVEDEATSAPVNIAVDSKGRVYIVEAIYHCVKVFDKNGRFLRKWGKRDGKPGIYKGQFDTPSGVAIDSNDRVYIVDKNNNRIQVFDNFDGGNKYLGRWGSTGEGNGEFMLPEGIVVTYDNYIYVVDTENHRIQRFAPFDFLPTGRIVGKVSNHGTPLSGVKIEVIALDTGEIIDTVFTDENGEYVIDNIIIGEYMVKIFNKDGYTGSKSYRVVVKANETTIVEEAVLLRIIPQTVELHNYPNPFDPQDGKLVYGTNTVTNETFYTDGTIIYYSLPVKSEQVFVEIYNLSGELIQVWELKNQQQGKYYLPWDGRSKDGNIVADGVYFCVLITDDKTKVCKIAVKK